MGFFNNVVQKLNPAQPYLSANGREESASLTPNFSYQQCYQQLEVVNRAVNMLVDDAAGIKFSIGEELKLVGSYKGTRKVSLEKLLNKQPNPFQDQDSFRRALFMDFVLDGNAFVYYDGTFLYHLPATKMVVLSDAKKFVSGYSFDGGNVEYNSNEIIHIKDNSFKTLYRGSSRLEPALRTMNLMIKMRKFQENFFDNGAVAGIVLKTENVLNARLKERMLQDWKSKYKPTSGARTPIILDGGFEIDSISSQKFSELDFQEGMKECESTVLKALGIPPIIMDSGNNANIRPNHRLYYLETIIPIINKFNSAFEKFFGFEIYEDTTYVEALRPELREQAAYLQGLVVSGIISRNEARLELGKEPMEGHDELVIPANVAGSALNPSLGGAPNQGTE